MYILQEDRPMRFSIVYYPSALRGGEYKVLGVFLLQYFPLVKILNLLHYNYINKNIVWYENKKHLRGNTQATIHLLSIILPNAL